mmetsp:Transcript_20352/g.48391  ORF Transcript_20352/g.48391 Transcript_20352/m.48391 type:complete len:551 (+) Transcript_20352:425-2077(+)
MVVCLLHLVLLLTTSIIEVSSRPVAISRLRSSTTIAGEIGDSNDTEEVVHEKVPRLGNFFDMLRANNQGDGEIEDSVDDDQTGLMGALQNDELMHSFPSASPSIGTMASSEPSVSVAPSSGPSVSTMPSKAPSNSVEPSTSPSVSTMPSMTPSVSVEPSTNPSVSTMPSSSPSVSDQPSSSPSINSAPTTATDFPSVSSQPSAGPTVSVEPSQAPSIPGTSTPTLTNCPGIDENERIAAILRVLLAATNSSSLTDITTPQGLATFWILDQDEFQACPDDPKLVQRWALAVMYYSTEGDFWDECFDGDVNCGIVDETRPEFDGADPFLAPVNECTWAGITCNSTTLCVTRIEFELNNLAGTIPTELGLLTDLVFLGLEQGSTTGTIPSELGGLSNLNFIDLDFNLLNGSIPSELFGLSNLATLDLNDNDLTGNIDGFENLVSLTFVQLENNLFTGTLPENLGAVGALGVFTLNNNNFSGTIPTSAGLLTNLEVMTLNNNTFVGQMPDEVCALRGPPVTADGNLVVLSSDCGGPNPEIICTCCSTCTAFIGI